MGVNTGGAPGSACVCDGCMMLWGCPLCCNGILLNTGGAALDTIVLYGAIRFCTSGAGGGCVLFNGWKCCDVDGC